MAKKRRVRNFLGSLYNVKAWFGYKHVASGAAIVSSTAKIVMNTKKSTVLPSEEFDEAMERLQFSESDIAAAQTGYLRNFVIFFMMGLLFALYSMYRFHHAQWLSGFVSLLLTALVFIFSLSAHFWYFQIKNRKLGCSLKEWYHNKINI
jgi:intracellular multiplication protein IcmV